MKEKGVIYIFTNPSFPEYVKIGYADDVNERLDILNSSTAVPFAFRVYATYEVDHKLEDKKVHKIIDTINPELRSVENVNGKIRKREFFQMSKEQAYTLLECIAEISGTKDRLHLIKATENDIKEEKDKLEKKLKKYNEKINSTNSILKDLYKDKTNNIIKLDDFEMFYKDTIQEKEEYIEKIKQLQIEIMQINKKLDNVDIDKIEKQAKEVLNLENITKEMYQKLIERIEFDKEKNIYIKFKFSKYMDT